MTTTIIANALIYFRVEYARPSMNGLIQLCNASKCLSIYISWVFQILILGIYPSLFYRYVSRPIYYVKLEKK